MEILLLILTCDSPGSVCSYLGPWSEQSELKRLYHSIHMHISAVLPCDKVEFMNKHQDLSRGEFPEPLSVQQQWLRARPIQKNLSWPWVQNVVKNLILDKPLSCCVIEQVRNKKWLREWEWIHCCHSWCNNMWGINISWSTFPHENRKNNHKLWTLHIVTSFVNVLFFAHTM